MATNLTPLTVVGVNNGSGGGIRQVLMSTPRLTPPVIDELILKVVAKTGKKINSSIFVAGKVCSKQEPAM